MFSFLVTFFKDRAFFTSGLLDEINSYTRKRLTFLFSQYLTTIQLLFGSPFVWEQGEGRVEVECPPAPQVESRVNLVPGSFYLLGAFSVRKVIRLPFWLRYLHHDGKNTVEPRDTPPAPRADIQHKYPRSGLGSHDLSFGARYQETEDQSPSRLFALGPSATNIFSPTLPLLWPACP